MANQENHNFPQTNKERRKEKRFENRKNVQAFDAVASEKARRLRRRCRKAWDKKEHDQDDY